MLSAFSYRSDVLGTCEMMTPRQAPGLLGMTSGICRVKRICKFIRHCVFKTFEPLRSRVLGIVLDSA